SSISLNNSDTYIVPPIIYENATQPRGPARSPMWRRRYSTGMAATRQSKTEQNLNDTEMRGEPKDGSAEQITVGRPHAPALKTLLLSLMRRSGIFALDETTGLGRGAMHLEPAGAEIISPSKRSWYAGMSRHIAPGVLAHHSQR